VQQQGLAVEIRVFLDGILGAELLRARRDEALREQLVGREPLPWAASDDDGQVRLRRMRLRRREGRLDADVGFLTRCENDDRRGSSNSFAKKDGTCRRMMVRP